MDTRFFLSGFIALCFECLIVGMLIFALLPQTKQTYVLQNQTKLDLIQIDEVIQDKPKEKPITKKIIDKKPSQIKAIDKGKQKSSPVVGSDVKKLFERVDSVDAPVREERIEDERPLFSANSIKTQDYSYNHDSSNIQEEASKIQDRLNQIVEKEIEIKTSPPVDLDKGVYDAWFAEIKKILTAKWQNEFYEKVSLTASIVINSDGGFSFKIIKYSTNSSYNAYMQSLLESLESETFPPYPKGNRITIEVSFSTNTSEGVQ